MSCPICSRPLEAGHITGKSILRFMPGVPEQKTTRYTPEDIAQLKINPEVDGWPLDVEYTGMAPFIQAYFCRHCGKVYGSFDIISPGKEESV